MAQQTSDWTAEDFAAEAPEDEGWSAADFDQEQPEEPSLIGAFGGTALEQISSLPGAADIATQKLSSPGARSVLGGRTPEEQAQHEAIYSLEPELEAAAQAEPTPFKRIESGMRAGAQAVYPEEQRGRGGLPEQLASGAGSIAAGALSMAAGPAAATTSLFAMGGVPLYYDIKAKTGNEEAATLGLLFGGITAQLNQLGIDRALGGTLAKLATGRLGEALKKSFWAETMKGALSEEATEIAEQGLVDAFTEVATGEDLDNLGRVQQILLPTGILGGAGGAGINLLMRAADRAASQAPREAQGAQQAQEAEQPAYTDQLRPQPTPARTVADIGPETAPKVANQGTPQVIAAEEDTRGKGIQYHGSSAPVNFGGEYAGPSEMNIYGPGFYTTEAADVAKGYTKKGKGREPSLYRVEEKEPVKVFDLEGKISESPDVYEALSEKIEDPQNATDEIFSMAFTEVGGKNASWREVYDAARGRSAGEGIPAREMQETFFEIADALEELGYGGISHIGGKKSGRAPHKVKIYFRPEQQLRLVRLSEPKKTPAPGQELGAAPAQEVVTAAEATAAGATQPGPTEPLAPPTRELPQEPAATEGTVPEQKTTGIKNRTVERELTEMGMPLPEKAERSGFVEWHAEAVARTKKDSDAGRKLVDELADHPRAVDENEKALLSLEANKRINEREEAEAAFIDEPSDANKARVERAKEAYKKAADVFSAAGTTWGRAGVARQMMIARDESLAAIERSMLAAAGGNITEAESSRISKHAAELAKELKKTREAHEKYAAESEAKAAEAATRAAQLELENASLKNKKSLISKKRRRDRGAKILESKKRIDEILNRLSQGHKAASVLGALDPAKVALTFQLATEHIRLGYQSFALWSEEVVAKVGEHIRPYLQPAWDKAKEAEEQEMLKAYKSRKRTDIAKAQEQLATKRFDSKRRETPIHKDKEALRLKAEYEAVRSKVASEKRRLEIASMSKGKKLARAVHRLIRTPPHLLASFDLGGMLQQGGFFTLGHPLETLFSHLPRSLKAMGSEKAAREQAARIQNHPLFELAVASKLPLMDWEGGTLSQREESLSESFAENIPVVGRGVKASNRQYTTFMNAQRFDNFVRQVMAHGKDINPEIAKKIAADIGVVTGRGAVGTGRFAKAVDFLSSIFWSPRKNIGSFQTLTGQVFYRKGNRMRMAAEYVRSIMGAVGLLSLAYTAARAFGEDEEDVEVEGNPLSTSFGKLRVGDTTYDFFGGKNQWITFMARQAANMMTTSKGRTYSMKRTAKEHGYTDQDITDVAKNFIRGKLTPTIGAYIDWRTGENARGEEVSGIDVLRDLVIPITPGDMYEAFKKHGVSRAMADSLVSIIGGSVQIKDKKKTYGRSGR